MTARINHGQAACNGARFMWMGFALGLACMAALFSAGLATGMAGLATGMAGLATGSAGLVVMASSAAAALGAAWSAASSASGKAAGKAARKKGCRPPSLNPGEPPFPAPENSHMLYFQWPCAAGPRPGRRRWQWKSCFR